MADLSKAFSGFSTDDVPAARAFYADVLGLDVSEENGMLFLRFESGHEVLVYPKGPAHEPAFKEAHAPHLGEHTREILGEMAYGAADIERLTASGVVACYTQIHEG